MPPCARKCTPFCPTQDDRLRDRRQQYKSPPDGFASPKDRFQEACRTRVRAQRAALVERYRGARRDARDSIAEVREAVLEAMRMEHGRCVEDDDAYDPEFWEGGALLPVWDGAGPAAWKGGRGKSKNEEGVQCVHSACTNMHGLDGWGTRGGTVGRRCPLTAGPPPLK
jgi:hypothetical protein